MNIETRQCEDGSSTLYLPDMDETYHSIHGAITESQHVYIEAGLAQFHSGEVTILEFGFGTGLNALLSLRFANETELVLKYFSVEKFPLGQEQLASLNYGARLDMQTEWTRLHQIAWNEWQEWGKNHQLYKYEGDFREIDLPENSCDLLYYDAFAPSKQPEVWSMDYLAMAYRCLKSGGILVTYCAKGQFRRDIESLGFAVSRLGGPPGKMEMIRAQKI